MLEKLYENIGGKIKSWAVWIFIAEAISAIITGLILMATSEYLLLSGLLTVIFGPFIAFVSSLTLYGFGELIEKTCYNEANTREIIDLLNKKNDKNTAIKLPLVHTSPQSEQNTPPTSDEPDNNSKNASTFPTEKNTIICSLCNFEQPNHRTVCWHCGANFKPEKTPDAHKWLCYNCKKMRTQSPCEYCGKE